MDSRENFPWVSFVLSLFQMEEYYISTTLIDRESYICFDLYPFFVTGKTITKKVILCIRDSKFWTHSRGHLRLGLDGLIRISIVTKRKLFSEDIQRHILGMFVNLCPLLCTPFVFKFMVSNP